MKNLANGLTMGADDRARLSIPGSSGVAVDGLHGLPVQVAGCCLLSYNNRYAPVVKRLLLPLSIV